MAAIASKAPPVAVRRGRLEVPFHVFLFGVEGVGKSSFAAGAPDPFFVSFEGGTAHLDVERGEPRTWQEAIALVRWAGAEKYRTIVLDTVNWLESLCHAHVCAEQKWSSIEDPGYGKGYVAALNAWREMLADLERIWQGGKNIILLAHAERKVFTNPEGGAWDRYEVAMHAKSAGLLKQWADAVLFAIHETTTKKEGQRTVGISTGAHVMHTAWSAAWDAKNRLNLPAELPLSWRAFADAAAANGPERARALKEQIAAGVEAIGDAAVTKKVTAYVADAKGDVNKLAEIANAVAVKLAEVQGNKENGNG